MLFSAFSANAVRKNQLLPLSPTSSLSLAKPKLQAEMLIKGLNLFPKDDANSGVTDNSAPQIVEKQFRFPVLGSPGPSIQEFAHHAGYYKLPHAKAAR